MIVDYFAKPLQGSPFIKLCNFIMGVEDDDAGCQTPRSVLSDENEHSEENVHSEADEHGNKVNKQMGTECVQQLYGNQSKTDETKTEKILP